MKRLWVALALAVPLLLSACSGDSTAPVPVPTDPPTLVPTTVVGFQVAVTQAPSPPRPHATAVPTPTQFVPPRHPYLLLLPNWGPPASRTVQVQGGNLPPSRAIDLVWSPNGRSSPLGTTTYTDKRGNFQSQFSVPGSPPGTYRVMVRVGDVIYASSPYIVRSSAVLSVQVALAHGGEQVTVSGHSFLSDLQLLLVAYPMLKGSHPIIVGRVKTDNHGAFTISAVNQSIIPGQYLIRAWSTSDVSAQMAETFFEVIT